jgi:putative phosphoribosyl transferase
MYAGRPDVRVLALPRGGVPVGYEVAKALQLPMDVFVVRKLGLPGHEEFAMGAVAGGGTTVVDEEVVERFGITTEAIEQVLERERAELERRQQLYRRGQPPLDVTARTVILVDDGLATGSTMKAAVAALRKQGVKRVVVAVPVGAWETCEMLREVADAVVCAETPEPFHAVGEWYADFEQTTDEQVRDLLERAGRESSVRSRRDAGDEAAPRSP